MSEYRQISFEEVALLLEDAAGVCSGRENTGVALRVMSLRSYRSPFKAYRALFKVHKALF